MFATFTLALTAQVPIICRIEADELFCNAGYSLYIESLDSLNLVDSGGPTIKQLPALPDGQRYVINAVQM